MTSPYTAHARITANLDLWRKVAANPAFWPYMRLEMIEAVNECRRGGRRKQARWIELRRAIRAEVARIDGRPIYFVTPRK